MLKDYSAYSTRYLVVKLEDDNFSIEIPVKEIQCDEFRSIEELLTICSTIIDVYSKRNLNVAKNLYLLMRKNKWVKFEDQIYYFNKYVKGFNNYIDEIKKYKMME